MTSVQPAWVSTEPFAYQGETFTAVMSNVVGDCARVCVCVCGTVPILAFLAVSHLRGDVNDGLPGGVGQRRRANGKAKLKWMQLKGT